MRPYSRRRVTGIFLLLPQAGFPGRVGMWEQSGMFDTAAFVKRTLEHNRRVHELIPDEEYLFKVDSGEIPRKLRDFADPVPEERNPRALFRGGYLRKGGALFLVSVSGAGKSVITMQSALKWALGRSAFGIEPVRPLSIGVFQTEDDDEENAFFRENMRRGLAAEGWSDDEIAAAELRVSFERSVGIVGENFLARLRSVQARAHYDLIVVNPLQAFFGGNLCANEEVSRFVREGLDPIIKDADLGCGLFVVHHTNKAPSPSERKGWGTDEFAAYVGAGGAELVNWMRAMLVLMPTGVPGWYTLIAAKRGRPLHWPMVGKKANVKLIAQSEDMVYWREPAPVDVPADVMALFGGAPAKGDGKSAEDEAALLGGKCLPLAVQLRKKPMNATDLRNLAIERYGVHGSRPVLKHLQDHLADFDLATARHPVSRHFYFGTRQAVTRLTGVTFGTGAVQRHLSLVTPSPVGGEGVNNGGAIQMTNAPSAAEAVPPPQIEDYGPDPVEAEILATEVRT